MRGHGEGGAAWHVLCPVGRVLAPASPALIQALRKSADEDQLTDIARQDGFLSFGDDAFLKARRGLTTLSEVHRIVGGGD